MHNFIDEGLKNMNDANDTDSDPGKEANERLDSNLRVWSSALQLERGFEQEQAPKVPGWILAVGF